MTRIYSNRDRPYDLGNLPVERLARDAAAPVVDARMPEDAAAPAADSIAAAIPEYRELCAKYLDQSIRVHLKFPPGRPSYVRYPAMYTNE